LRSRERYSNFPRALANSAAPLCNRPLHTHTMVSRVRLPGDESRRISTGGRLDAPWLQLSDRVICSRVHECRKETLVRLLRPKEGSALT
jgi:hypothetical protein